MIRGTTPTLIFDLPMDTKNLEAIYVTIGQKGRIILDKGIDALERSGKRIILRLTQKDTLELQGNQTSEIQIRVKTFAGDALASRIFQVNTERILKDGVI